MLVLNSTIQAACSDDRGEGFAVVVDKVRALTERTSMVSKKIGEMIRVIQSKNNGVIIAMERIRSQPSPRSRSPHPSRFQRI